MTVQDYGPAAVSFHPSGEVAVLVWRPSGDPSGDERSWDQAVTEAARRGFTAGFDWPAVSDHGYELYISFRR